MQQPEIDTTNAFTFYEGVSERFIPYTKPSDGSIGYYREDSTLAVNDMLTTLRRVYPDGYFSVHGLPAPTPQSNAEVARAFDRKAAIKTCIQAAATTEGKVLVAIALKAPPREVIDSLGLQMTVADLEALIQARTPHLAQTYKLATQ